MMIIGYSRTKFTWRCHDASNLCWRGKLEMIRLDSIGEYKPMFSSLYKITVAYSHYRMGFRG